MGEPLSNSMGKWIASTEAKTTEHNIFNGEKKKDKWKNRTVLHSRIIFHTFRRLVIFLCERSFLCYFHTSMLFPLSSGRPFLFNLRFRLVTLTWNSARSITEPLVSWWCIDVTLSNDKKQKWRTNKESSILNVSFLCAFVLSFTISPARIMMKTRMCGEVKCVRNWRDAIRR